MFYLAIAIVTLSPTIYYLHGIASGKFCTVELNNDRVLNYIKSKLFPEGRWSSAYYAETCIPADEHIPPYVSSTWQSPGHRRISSTPDCRKDQYLDIHGEIPFELRTENLPYMNSDRAQTHVNTMLQTSKWSGCYHEPVSGGNMQCLGKHFR